MDEREKDSGPSFGMYEDSSHTVGCEKESSAIGIARQVKDDLKQSASGAVDQVKHEARELQHKADDVISHSTEQVSHTLQNVCHCLRESADESEKEHPVIGKYVRSAADSMEKLSESLKHKDVDFFLHGTEEMARKQPGIFLGSAFTIGFAIGRYLKGRSTPSMGEDWRNPARSISEEDASEIWRRE